MVGFFFWISGSKKKRDLFRKQAWRCNFDGKFSGPLLHLSPRWDTNLAEACIWFWTQPCTACVALRDTWASISCAACAKSISNSWPFSPCNFSMTYPFLCLQAESSSWVHRLIVVSFDSRNLPFSDCPDTNISCCNLYEMLSIRSSVLSLSICLRWLPPHHIPGAAKAQINNKKKSFCCRPCVMATNLAPISLIHWRVVRKHARTSLRPLAARTQKA